MSVRRRPVGSERSAAQRCGAAGAAECDPPVRDPKLRKIPRFYNVSGGFLPTPGTTAHAPGHSRALRGRRHSGGPGRRTDRKRGCRNGGGQRGKAAARKRLRAERRQERGEAAGTGQSEAGGSTMAPQRAVTGNRPQAASGNGQQRRRKRAAPTQGTAQQRTKGAAPYEEYGAGYTATSTSGGGAAGPRRCRAAIRPQAAAPGRTTVRRRTAGRTSAGRWPW